MPLNLTQNALVVLQRRYLKKDKNGVIIENPEEMFRRVSQNITSAETLYNPNADLKKIENEFFEAMSNLEFLPNSPTLMNAGRRLQQLAACFVLPVEDSLDSIFDAVKETAIIHQSGGGTGFSFSRLRPKDDMVGSTSGAASGPVSFMKVFNTATEVIKQGGTRRGANMGVLRVDHPDIIDFATVKNDPLELTNFNISVAVTDVFMKAVEEGREYPLINPRTNEIVKNAKAKDIFDLIVESAWKSGEPGVLFIDRINQANPTPHIGLMDATNPCGEQPLLPYEPCNLGSINLSKMLRKAGNRQEAIGYEIDYKKLERLVRLGIRFLDNVIDMNKYPLPDIERMAKGNRKIGLGVMGFADMLVRLKVPYDSEKAQKIGEGLMQFIKGVAWEASRELAEERGAFPNIKGSIFDKPGVKPVRNATTTTVAPTGTLSIIAGCSSGIEPIYSLSYTRQVLNGIQLPELHPLLSEIAKGDGFYSDELMDYIAKEGSLEQRKDVPDGIKKIFVTAFQILPEGHVRMQAAFQKHTDNAVSKTINFPPEATPADVKKAYLMAYQLGCKGITVYRSGTRAEQVLTCRSTLYC
ncbi:MAG: ribonucleoside-diphosphate reductase, adenosylcobalamin-dependent [Deltaproteobacteria bacterium RIFCSPLOWO2_12_FULL_43_16]|nr:MAG: ribonucleoside-diphosphate reductase, adenosylcobalamin-dependent [Deltaproteobacteria bacterium GWA2_43_19]OGQ11237.1 MAG: ribonucleoside-diphosphate reductase, adenosylcobalamin-dependent [Deltaproteobacteria bacterium RIFCSPHIGHO2_02_FULL_43_33]OGQ60478.1 MAG: ribonucleoside-diphosphate reductase, adenosylcobalamin-dependent [Deltaproteobacteria bacterium RIFCSPLOWO2_12_FULL_43_16]HBR17408.1 ribonucleotide-diphosphate reductase subunit alpha [Deltaproteobacteria bacterium]